MHEGGDGQLADQLLRVDAPSDARGYVDWVARENIAKVLGRLERHEAECDVRRRGTEQWQESTTRVLDERFTSIHEAIGNHASKDEAYQEKINGALADWNRWVIRGLVVALIAVCGLALRLGWLLASMGHGP